MAKKLTPYYAFRIYFTLREHFAKSFDITDYNWNFLKPKEKNFEEWKGHAIFKILANYKIQSVHEWISILIVGFMSNPTMSFHVYMNEYEYWKEKAGIWNNHIANMPRTFACDATGVVRAMFDVGMTFNEKLPVWILEQYLDKKLCVESFIIFKKILKFGLDGNIDYEYLYRGQYGKYELLLNINEEKYKKILETVIINEKSRRKAMTTI